MALCFLSVLTLTACSSVPASQRMVLTVRDAASATPAAYAHLTLEMNRKPGWMHAQPIDLHLDNLGMGHALLVYDQAAYKVTLHAEDETLGMIRLPVLDNHFAFGKWLPLSPVRDGSQPSPSAETSTSTDYEIRITLP